MGAFTEVAMSLATVSNKLPRTSHKLHLSSTTVLSRNLTAIGLDIKKLLQQAADIAFLEAHLAQY